MTTFVGKYALEAQIGSGGHSVVYRSSHPVLQRPVAVKVLHGPSAHDAEVRARFLREAQLVLGLRHPGIVPLYDIGDSDDGLFLVTELFEHGSLARLLERGRLPLQRALAVSISIADALAYAHSRGVVHGDIKPSNVLLRSDGTPVVADFGSASDRVAAGAVGQPTFPAQGTPAYCAPEQFEGRPGDVRSDVYSFGVLVYELLAGRLPFEGTAHEMMFAHLRTLPPPLHTYAPHVPLELSLLVEQLLAKQRSSRPADMAAIAARLGAFADRPSLDATAQAAPAHQPARKPVAYQAEAALGATVQLPLATAAPQPAQPTPAPAGPPNRQTIAYSQPPGVAGGRGRTGWFQAVVAIFIALGLLMLPRILADVFYTRHHDVLVARRAYEPSSSIQLGATPTISPTPEVVTYIPVEVLDQPLQTLERHLEADAQSWSVGSVGVYQDASSIRVYGVLRNRGEHDRADPVVRVFLRDASGVELAANDAPVQGSSLPTGGYGGFRTVFDTNGSTLPEAYQYTLDFAVRSDAGVASQRGGPTSQQVETIALEYALPDTYRWNATVFDRAAGDGATRAHAIFYDNSGAVVGLDSASVDSAAYNGAGYPTPAPHSRAGYPAPPREVAGYPAPPGSAPAQLYLVSGEADFMEHAPSRAAVILE